MTEIPTRQPEKLSAPLNNSLQQFIDGARMLISDKTYGDEKAGKVRKQIDKLRLAVDGTYGKEKYRMGEGIERSTAIIEVGRVQKLKETIVRLRLRSDTPIFHPESGKYSYPFIQMNVVKNKAGFQADMIKGTQDVVGSVRPAAFIDCFLDLHKVRPDQSFNIFEATKEDVDYMLWAMSGIDKNKKLNLQGNTAEDAKRIKNEVRAIHEKAESLIVIAGDKASTEKGNEIAIFADAQSGEVINIIKQNKRFGLGAEKIIIEHLPTQNKEKNPETISYYLHGDNSMTYHDRLIVEEESRLRSSSLSDNEAFAEELLNPGRYINHNIVKEEDRRMLLQKLNILHEAYTSEDIGHKIFGQ